MIGQRAICFDYLNPNIPPMMNPPIAEEENTIAYQAPSCGLKIMANVNVDKVTATERPINDSDDYSWNDKEPFAACGGQLCR